MTQAAYSEDVLVQQTTAEYLARELGWESVYAYSTETFGPEGTLGRTSDREVVLTRAGCGLADNDKEPCRAVNGEHLGNCSINTRPMCSP